MSKKQMAVLAAAALTALAGLLSKCPDEPATPGPAVEQTKDAGL